MLYCRDAIAVMLTVATMWRSGVYPGSKLGKTVILKWGWPSHEVIPSIIFSVTGSRRIDHTRISVTTTASRDPNTPT